jgi:hypothetical protein
MIARGICETMLTSGTYEVFASMSAQAATKEPGPVVVSRVAVRPVERA